MKIPMTLRLRFLISVAVLLTVILVSILLVIENREVKAIFQEEVDKSILRSKYIIQINLTHFLFGDRESVRENVEHQIDLKLIYVVFFSKDGSPFVTTPFVRNDESIAQNSYFRGRVTEGSYHYERKTLKDRLTGQILRILEIEIPIFTEGSTERWGSIKIGTSLEDMLLAIRKTRRMLLLIGLGWLLFGVLGAVLLARHITGPLKKLVDGTVKIARGDFSQQINIRSQDEIGNLAESFNQMSRRLQRTRKKMEEANKKLIQVEKLASVGRMSAGIAHEIRNPLTSVKLNIQKVMASRVFDGVERDHMKIANEGIGQIESFIREMLNYTRVSELNMDDFSMVQIMDESLKMVVDSLEMKKIRVEKNFQDGIPAFRVDAEKLRLVFVNLLRNAYEAVDEGGLIRIDVSLADDNPESKWIKVEISDNGPGIPAKDWETVFEPYFTTKSSGFGFGLANARKVIEQHKGTIRIKKSPAFGITFEIRFPCEEEK